MRKKQKQQKSQLANWQQQRTMKYGDDFEEAATWFKERKEKEKKKERGWNASIQLHGIDTIQLS